MNIPRDPGDATAPGPWWRLVINKEGKKSAWLRCPNGHFGSLWDHQIAPDGKVSPSVQCPEKGCSFHEVIQLEGWEG